MLLMWVILVVSFADESNLEISWHSIVMLYHKWNVLQVEARNFSRRPSWEIHFVNLLALPTDSDIHINLLKRFRDLSS